jgi:hypothetical protein
MEGTNTVTRFASTSSTKEALHGEILSSKASREAVEAPILSGGPVAAQGKPIQLSLFSPIGIFLILSGDNHTHARIVQIP